MCDKYKYTIWLLQEYYQKINILTLGIEDYNLLLFSIIERCLNEIIRHIVISEVITLLFNYLDILKYKLFFIFLRNIS